jgi:hypothetical protein
MEMANDDGLQSGVNVEERLDRGIVWLSAEGSGEGVPKVESDRDDVEVGIGRAGRDRLDEGQEIGRMPNDEVLVVFPGLAEDPTVTANSIWVVFVRLELRSEGDHPRYDLLDDLDVVFDFLGLAYEVADDIDGGIEQLVGREGIEHCREEGSLGDLGGHDLPGAKPAGKGLEDIYQYRRADAYRS